MEDYSRTMANFKKLGKIWKCVYSNSIENWHRKLDNRLNLNRWERLSLTDHVLFVGLYHWGDYLKLFWHAFYCSGQERRILWCGSDILALKESWWKNAVARIKVDHFCENEAEACMLLEMGIYPQVIPMIFDNPELYKPCFKPVSYPNVWLSAHPDREEEYGVPIMLDLAVKLPDFRFHIFGISQPDDRPFPDNVTYHGQVDEQTFNERIKEFQICFRPNKFDGFAETVAKAILLGQYPVTYIWYEGIAHFTRESYLYGIMKEIKNKVEPNPEEKYWREQFENSLKILTHE